mgnify:CR=1 FL=1
MDNVTRTTVADVMERLPETVGKTIDVLSDKLKAPAERLLGEVSRYVFATGVGHLVVAGVCATAAVAIALGLRHVWKTKWLQRNLEDKYSAAGEGVLFFMGCGFVGALVAATGFAHTGVVRVVAPTGAALVAILSGRGLP